VKKPPILIYSQKDEELIAIRGMIEQLKSEAEISTTTRLAAVSDAAAARRQVRSSAEVFDFKQFYTSDARVSRKSRFFCAPSCED
jgi:hypothetical protein